MESPKDSPVEVDQRQAPPLRVDVLADLAGNADEDPSRPSEPVEVSQGGLDAFMAAVAPALDLRVMDTVMGRGALPVYLPFRSMQDFQPDRVLSKLPRLQHLRAMRDGLMAVRALLAKDRAAAVPVALAQFDPRTRQPVDAPPAEVTAEAAADAADAGRGRPRAGSFQTQTSAEGVWSSRAPKDRPAAPPEGSGVAARLLAQARQTIADAEPDAAGPDPVVAIDERLAVVDAMLAGERDGILAALELPALEASWRGLDRFLGAVRQAPQVRVRVLSVWPADLADLRDLCGVAGAAPRRQGLDRRQSFGQAPRSLLLVEVAPEHGLADGPDDAAPVHAGLTPLHDRVCRGRTVLVQAPPLALPRSKGDAPPTPEPDWLSVLAACRMADEVRCCLEARLHPFAGPDDCAQAVQAQCQSLLASGPLQDGRGASADRDRIGQVVATVQADGGTGWRLHLAVTSAAAPGGADPVLLSLALPARCILALPTDRVRPVADGPQP